MKIKRTLLWVISIFLLFTAFGGFLNSTMSGILLLLCAIGFNPLFLQQLDKIGKNPNKQILIPFIIVLSFAGLVTLPFCGSDNTNKVVEVKQEKAVEADNKTIESAPETKSQSEVTETDVATAEPVVQDTQPSISALTVHYIDVGQGDATLITCGDEAMLIDAGNNNQSTNIQNYLQGQGITTLKYIIATQPDEEHIGGMQAVLNKFDCQTVMMSDESKEKETYKDIIDTMKKKGYENTTPVVGNTYSLGDATFTILSPTKNYDSSNDNSIVFLLAHGENKFMFLGDAGIKVEKDISDGQTDISVDVLKVGNHGSDTATSEALMKAAQPKYAVISVGSGNSYGYPTEQTLNRLNDAGTQIYRTDEQGTILATSNGKEITWSGNPSTTMKAGIKPEVKENTTNESKANESKAKENSSSKSSSVASNSSNNAETTTAVEPATETVEDAEPTSIEVHITKTGKKYHSAGCQYLRQSDIVTTLDTAKAKGLEPCSKCNPPR